MIKEICENAEQCLGNKAQIINEEKLSVKYFDILREGNNDYSFISKMNDYLGVYCFVYKNKVLYIGQASNINSNSNWSLCKRVKQHFVDGDKGGIRAKIKSVKNSEKI